MVLCTPALKLGARSGAVLGWVRRHTKVVEKELNRSDLRRATAMAVTNSRLGVMPVASLDGRNIENSLSHDIALTYLRSHGLLGDA
jgi:branched-subunit amino acid aminotransferase/4-amino-4-deoxychorismate lyase